MNALQMALVNAGVATEEQAVVETPKTKLCNEIGVLEKKLMACAPDVGTQLLMTSYKVQYIQAVREGYPVGKRFDILGRAKQFYERELSKTV